MLSSLSLSLSLSLIHTHTHLYTHISCTQTFPLHACTHTEIAFLDLVTVSLGEDALFFCNVTGSTDFRYTWLTVHNGVFPASSFPQSIFGDRVSGTDTSTLNISNVGPYDTNFDYACNISISGMLVASRIASLISDGTSNVATCISLTVPLHVLLY